MNKFITLLITLMLVLSLAACGGTEAPVDTSDPGAEQQEQQPGSTPDEGDTAKNGGGEAEWPADDFITDAMEYTGTGNLIFKASSTSSEDRVCWTVYIDAASVDEVTAYIAALKEDGFTHSPSYFYPEEKAAGEFDSSGRFDWEGEAADGRYIEVTHYQEPATGGYFGDRTVQLEIDMYSSDPDKS